MRKFLVRQVRDDSPDQQRPKLVFCAQIPVARRCSLGGGGWLDRCGDGSAVSSLL